MPRGTKIRRRGDRTGEPLVESPIRKEFNIESPISHLRLRINVLPEGWVLYEDHEWIVRPPAGVICSVEGQVKLYRAVMNGSNSIIESRSLRSIRCLSTGAFYGGPGNNHCPGEYIRRFDRLGVCDFDFYGVTIKFQ